MTQDNRLETNKSRLTDIVAVAKRTMTALLANIDKDTLARPSGLEESKKYDQYLNIIITNHLRNKFNLM